MIDKCDPQWLWVGCHAALATDGQITIAGNDYDPSAVIATIKFMNEFDGYADFEEAPYTFEIDCWIWDSWGMDPKDLSPDYSVCRQPTQEILGEVVGWIFQPPFAGW